MKHPGELEETICKVFGNNDLHSRTLFYRLLIGPPCFLLSKVTGTSPLPNTRVLHPPSCDKRKKEAQRDSASSMHKLKAKEGWAQSNVTLEEEADLS